MQNTEIPFLHTTNTNPVNSGAGAGALGSEFDDLRCVKTGDEFSWYFANLKLQDVSMHCGTNTAVFGEETYLTCGVFQVINKLEDLKWYHQVGAYSTAQVGISSWTPAFEFEITCEDGFKPVVFSENNPPIEVIQLIGNEFSTRNVTFRSPTLYQLSNAPTILWPTI